VELGNVTFRGPEFEANSPVIDVLPENLVALFKQINGFVQFAGGLHVRGVCEKPTWHSIGEVMVGPLALHHLYKAILPTDAPFAQDCVADQFLLRDGIVYKLQSETGELESLGFSLSQFFLAIEADPIEFLAMQPLLRFQRNGSMLEPGQVLHVYPPFCTKEAANGVSLRAVSATEALAFLAHFSRQLSGVPNGEQFQVRVVP
jgi:hypothetical protein